MYKCWNPHSFNVDFNPIELVRSTKAASGVDDGWLKSASVSSKLDKVFEAYQLKKGHVLVFVAPVAESERYGCNTNGDGFKAAACRDYHQTFLDGNAFIEHANTDPSKGYGRPVATAYNEKLGRVELLVDIDTEKNAKIMEDLEAGRAVDFSMACRIDYDECSVCGNKATKTAGRCDQPTDVPSPGYCKHAREDLGKLMTDGHRVHVDNPHPMWFDISHVQQPAEVIARTLHYKAAAAGDPGFMSGAELAAQVGLGAPLYSIASIPRRSQAKQALVLKIAEIEKTVPAHGVLAVQSRHSTPRPVRAFSEDGVTAVPDTKLRKKAYAVLRAKQVVLSLEDFASLEGLEVTPKEKEASRNLFSTIIDGQLTADVCNNGSYDDHGSLPMGFGGLTAGEIDLSDDVVKAASLHPRAVRFRAIHGGSMMTDDEARATMSASRGAFDPTTQTSTLLQKYAAYTLSELSNTDEAGLTASENINRPGVVYLTALGRVLQ